MLPWNGLTYVVAVVLMMALGVVGAVSVIFIRPEQDNTLLIASIFGFLTPTTLSLLAYMKSQETHKAVNSRMSEFIRKFNAQADRATIAAKTIGIAEGIKEGREAADARTDVLAAAKEK